MRYRLLVCLAALAILSTSLSARLAQPFEGTKWRVVVTPDDEARSAGEKEFKDVLVFKGLKFTSEACTPYGFGPVEYKEETAPGGLAASFTAEPVSEKEGKAHWHGTITAGQMTGEMTWTKKDGTVLNYEFKGEKVQS